MKSIPDIYEIIVHEHKGTVEIISAVKDEHGMEITGGTGEIIIPMKLSKILSLGKPLLSLELLEKFFKDSIIRSFISATALLVKVMARIRLK